MENLVLNSGFEIWVSLFAVPSWKLGKSYEMPLKQLALHLYFHTNYIAKKKNVDSWIRAVSFFKSRVIDFIVWEVIVVITKCQKLVKYLKILNKLCGVVQFSFLPSEASYPTIFLQSDYAAHTCISSHRCRRHSQNKNKKIEK